MTAMEPLKVGDVAPAFALPDAAGDLVRVPDPAGHAVLLMFFQEAATPTCTTQIGSLAREAPLLHDLGAIAACLSADPPERLRAFAAQLGTPALAFISDEDGTVARAYGVYDPVSRRARRAAFAIGGDGHVMVAIPWYNPLNSAQLAELFLQLAAGGDEEADHG